VQYRLSPHTTIGGNYTFYRFSYSHSLGGAYIHTAAFAAAHRVSPSTEFSFYAGASRLESSFEQTVPVAPAILAILCPPSARVPCPVSGGTVISNTNSWGPMFGARISRSFLRGVAYLNAGKSVTPGNGLFLTSNAITASAGYGYTVLRQWSLSVSATYISATSLGNVTGKYGEVAGAYRMSRQIVGSLSFVSSFTVTRYRSDSFTGYNRLIYAASVGIGFSPGRNPVRFF
jgi:hypothetical protein